MASGFQGPPPLEGARLWGSSFLGLSGGSGLLLGLFSGFDGCRKLANNAQLTRVNSTWTEASVSLAWLTFPALEWFLSGLEVAVSRPSVWVLCYSSCHASWLVKVGCGQRIVLFFG